MLFMYYLNPSPCESSISCDSSLVMTFHEEEFCVEDSFELEYLRCLFSDSLAAEIFAIAFRALSLKRVADCSETVL